MKIKVKPEDFVVKEKTSLVLRESGDFGVYSLTKTGWNTIDLLRELARRCNVPSGAIAYGGRKDRHGITTQYITVGGKRLADLNEKDYSLFFLGYSDTPMEPAAIESNGFTITVRDIDSAKLSKALGQVEDVKAFGFANYFDDQRLASCDPVQGFFAEKILKKQFNGALKIYLTGISSSDKNEDKLRKKFFFDHWKDWTACGQKAKTRVETAAFGHLASFPSGFLEILRDIPYYDLSIYCSAYQSFLWNEILRFMVNNTCRGQVCVYPGICGDYVFPGVLRDKSYENLLRRRIPVPGLNPLFTDPAVKLTYMNVLKDNDLRQPLFNNSKFRNVIFKSFQRQAVIKPEGLKFCHSDDELYPGRKKLQLTFSLGRGAYATMLIKRLFAVVE